ncbi:hypothetical protein ACJJTC_015504 [Scirpophaga incertulas]
MADAACRDFIRDATVVLIIAVVIAKPVFLTPLRTDAEPPLGMTDLLASLQPNSIVGYVPVKSPFTTIMNRVAELLKTDIMAGASEDDLNKMLYDRAKKTTLKSSCSSLDYLET